MIVKDIETVLVVTAFIAQAALVDRFEKNPFEAIKTGNRSGWTRTVVQSCFGQISELQVSENKTYYHTSSGNYRRNR